MACTTILVGKNASYDGSTMVARNDDSGSGHFTAKKFVVVQPEEHPLSLIHISESTRRTPISYAVFCLKKKKKNLKDNIIVRNKTTI